MANDLKLTKCQLHFFSFARDAFSGLLVNGPVFFTLGDCQMRLYRFHYKPPPGMRFPWSAFLLLRFLAFSTAAFTIPLGENVDTPLLTRMPNKGDFIVAYIYPQLSEHIGPRPAVQSFVR